MSSTYIPAKEMSLGRFIRHLKRTIHDAPNARVFFFLGSGCSVSSGIPTGADLARAWLLRLAEEDQDDIPKGGFLSWGEHRFPGELAEPGKCYAQIGRELFDSTSQQIEIERLTANKFPGHGYALLAQMMAHDRWGPQTNTVLTTNFDDLIADSLYLYTSKRPLVLVHEQMFEYAAPNRERPLIVKLHGDRQIASRNHPQEIHDQIMPIYGVLDKLQRDSVLIFAGYGGYDVSISNALLKCTESHFSMGIYWIHSRPPPAVEWNKVREHFPKFTWVDHLDFDALMVRLIEALGIEPPCLDRARELRVRHRNTMRILEARFRHDERLSNAYTILRTQLPKHTASVLADLINLIEDDLDELASPDRVTVFSRLVQSPLFGAELKEALATRTAPGARPTDQTPQEIEDSVRERIVQNPRDAWLHLRLAQLLISNDKVCLTEARHHVDQALQDQRLANDATAVGTDAFLRALDQTINLSTWEIFERALSLNPHHRTNLVNYLLVLLGGDDHWMDFSAVKVWQWGRQLLRRLFELPWEGESPAEWFKALFCANAFYQESFAADIDASGWPDVFTNRSLILEPGTVFLERIANLSDSADPSGSGWAQGGEIGDAEFGDMEILQGQLVRVAAIQEESTVTHFASSFLSHAWPDKLLVRAVAMELGKRGVLTWFDESEVCAGQDLPRTLEKAILDQATLSVFLSSGALASPWVEDELDIALSRDEREDQGRLILPVFLGEPLDLVKQSPQLKSRWMHSDGKRVTQYGIKIDPTAEVSANAPIIAGQIADSVFHSIKASDAHKVVIYLDQRGSTRCGFPRSIPASLRGCAAAGLIVRPAAGEGAQKETIIGTGWDNLASTLVDALNRALTGVRWAEPKDIHLSGNAQLSLAYLIGHHFNRSSDAVLYCTDTRGTSFNNDGWDRTDMLRGGDPNCEANTDASLSPIPVSPFKEVVLVVGRDNVLEGARHYLNAIHSDTPIAWIRTPQVLRSSDEVKKLIADVTALAQRLKCENGCFTAYLVLGLPFAAVPLFAAHMPYVLDRFVLLEHRGDVIGTVNDAETYAQLQMPN